MKLMHEITHPSFDARPIFGTSQNKKQVSDDSVFTLPSFGLKENFKEVFDTAEMQNKMTNSIQFFNQLNSLQSQVTSLQQQVASYERTLGDLFSYNLILPKTAVQGISGYLCEKCKSFSLKPIFDLGYDMTMKTKHRCNDVQGQNNYLVFQVPFDIPNIDHWAGRVLLNHLAFLPSIGKYLFTRDLTKGFNDLREVLNIEDAKTFLGIPDNFTLYRVDKSDYIDTDWMLRAIHNLGKGITISDTEMLDFLTKVKSTYAIFEIRSGVTTHQIFMGLTSQETYIYSLLKKLHLTPG